MSQRKWQPPTSSSRKSQPNKDQVSFNQSSQGEELSRGSVKNVAITPNGSIFVKTLVQVDRKLML